MKKLWIYEIVNQLVGLWSMIMLGAFFTGFVAFSVANLDDLFVLMAWFSHSNSKIGKSHIIFGQYLGFLILVASSIFFSFGKFLLPPHWLGLLGILPIGIAIKEFIELRKVNHSSRHKKINVSVIKNADHNKRSFAGVLFNFNSYKVASVTIANGADSISIFTPLFASSSFERLCILTVVFLLMVGLWCFIALKLIKYPLIANTADTFGHLLLPFLLLGLGIYIMISSGTLSYIFAS